MGYINIHMYGMMKSHQLFNSPKVYFPSSSFFCFFLFLFSHHQIMLRNIVTFIAIMSNIIWIINWFSQIFNETFSLATKDNFSPLIKKMEVPKKIYETWLLLIYIAIGCMLEVNSFKVFQQNFTTFNRFRKILLLWQQSNIS